MTEIDRNTDIPQGADDPAAGPAAQVEAAIREFVRQDITQVRRVPVDGSAEVVTNINSLVQRGTREPA